MTFFSRYLFLFSLTAGVGVLSTSWLSAAEAETDLVVFTAKEQQARQQVLDTEHWKKTRDQFKQWLLVQTAYSPEELAQQEADLKQHIASLPALELIKFLEAMDERLAVLLSPDMNQARSWVDHYYTEKAQRRMAKKLDIDQPLKMTDKELQEALVRFQEQRASAAQSTAAFNSSRQSSSKSLESYRKKQQSVQTKYQSSKRSATFGSHYAPQKPQARATRYPSGRRSGGWRGWGGW
jgi:hypothetical protein